MLNKDSQSRRLSSNEESAIEQAAELIRYGGVVAFPTETVYGLGADAFNPIAVARVFEIKNRPSFDPLIVHISDLGNLDDLVERFDEPVHHLAERFWPGPLTIILPKRNEVPDIVTAGLPTVGVRMPDHVTALRLIRAAGTPIAAPSANCFGSVSPTTADHVRVSLGETSVDMILDGGDCAAGVESTIISFADSADLPILLRPGATPIEEIEEQIGRVRRAAPDGSKGDDNTISAPGMLKTHYSTRTPLMLIRQYDSECEWSALRAQIEREFPEHSKIGLLCLGSHLDFVPIVDFAAKELLSPAGDLTESAANLFAAMRRLDVAGLDLIVAIGVPDEGLGLAINDRLSWAAHRSIR